MTGTTDVRWVRDGIRWAPALVAAVALLLLVPTGAGAADPPGNNGTVKVDDVAFDDHPGNEPHVGCVFQIDFYGYDEGDLNADVTFEGVAPTGGGELLTDTVFIGEDSAGGGTDLDASETYDLSQALAAIEPHPVQGHHVRLTVNAEGSQGADVKHKVFWVEDCVPHEKPTEQPSHEPSEQPSHEPSEQPSHEPSEQPSHEPSEEPSHEPSEQPSDHDIPVPTRIDTGAGGSSGSPQPAAPILLTLAGASLTGVAVRRIRGRA
jgi:hypothetical protein